METSLNVRAIKDLFTVKLMARILRCYMNESEINDLTLFIISRLLFFGFSASEKTNSSWCTHDNADLYRLSANMIVRDTLNENKMYRTSIKLISLLMKSAIVI